MKNHYPVFGIRSTAKQTKNTQMTDRKVTMIFQNGQPIQKQNE